MFMCLSILVVMMWMNSLMGVVAVLDDFGIKIIEYIQTMIVNV